MKPQTSAQIYATSLAQSLLETARARLQEAGLPALALSVGGVLSKLDIYLANVKEQP
jgi:hypothetical protein